MKTHKNSHQYLITRATQVAVLVSLILIVSKIFAWTQTNSLSLKASLADSILDFFTSSLNFFIIRHALKPADLDHRFGHGKAEAISGALQSLFMGGASLFLVYEMVQRLLIHEPLESTFASKMVMGLSMALTLGLVLFQNYVVKKTNSIAIRADAVHYKSDFLSNTAVLISLNITLWPSFDALVGGLIACYIFYTAVGVGIDSFDILMDKELPDEILDQIKTCVESHPQVLGMHDLRTRSSGQKIFIQLHIDLEASLTLRDAHTISEEVEKKLQKIWAHAEILIHQDPAQTPSLSYQGDHQL